MAELEWTLANSALAKQFGPVKVTGVTKLHGGATKIGPSMIELADSAGETKRVVFKPVRASEAKVAGLVGQRQGRYGAAETIAAEIDDANPWEFTSWVLTHFVDGAPLSFEDRVPEQTLHALANLHADHREGVASFDWTWTFDSTHMRRTIAQAIEGVRNGRGPSSGDLANRLEPLIELQPLFALADLLPKTLCHGDIHPGNIITDADGKSWLIDWGNVCVAPPTLDIANLIPIESDSWRTYEAALLSAWPLQEATLKLAYHWAKVATGLQYLPWIAANTDAAAGMIDQVVDAADRLRSSPQIESP